jgi:hypothetical protein
MQVDRTFHTERADCCAAAAGSIATADFTTAIAHTQLGKSYGGASRQDCSVRGEGRDPNSSRYITFRACGLFLYIKHRQVGSFGLGIPPQPAGKRSNELWGNRIPSLPSGNSTGSLRRSETLSATPSGRARRVSTSDVQLGMVQMSNKALGSSSARQPTVVEEGGSRGSDMLSSLDIATPVSTSSSLAGRAFGQSASSPERYTIPRCDQDQTVSGIRDVPSVLVSSDPISSLHTDDSDTPQSAPEEDSGTAPANDAIEDCCNSNPDHTPLQADNDQRHTTVEEDMSSSLDANQTEVPRKADENLFNSHFSPLSDISQLEVPLSSELGPVGSSPLPTHFASNQLVPFESLVTVDEELSHGTIGNLSVPCDTVVSSSPPGDSPNAPEMTSVEDPKNNGKGSGEPVILEDQFVALAETNPPEHPAEFASSVTTQSQAECPSLSPSLSYDSSLPSVVPSSDVGSAQPVVHSDQSPHSKSSTFVSTVSSTTLASSSTLNTSPYLIGWSVSTISCVSN